MSEHISAFWDVFPTLCEIAGAPAPQRDAISMLPELTGGEQPQHEYLYWEFYWWQAPRQAARQGDWKAVRQSGPDSPMELYHLTQDPGEQQDLAMQHPEKLAEFKDIFNSAHTESELWELT
ncbi:MAG: hypothetical protein U5R06_21625 [candidate division KSB1 bacterium]|nr:hypothetical protein [candidate division KSB1 bacterium]